MQDSGLFPRNSGGVFGLSKRILGISAFYHDSAAALIDDGYIVAAAQEERFSRKKHDAGFPANAIIYCLSEAETNLESLDAIVFYDKPLIKFERLLETYLAYAPRGFRSFLAAMPVWLKEKLFLKSTLRRELAALANCEEKDLPDLQFTEHHQAHAASAFFPSPYQSASVLCLDGVGEWATGSVWHGEGNALTSCWEIDFPHSLGLLYSAFTYYTGFKVNSGEYKLMGLAPYGEPKYLDEIYDNLIDLKEDGTFRLNMKYFNYATGLTMTNDRFADLFGGPPRTPETDISQREMDIARSIQVVTEDVVLRLARTVHKEHGTKHLCMAGGVALNCVANGRILREGPFEEIWIQPAAGDAGGALGAALASWHEYFGEPREVGNGDSMRGSYLGSRYGRKEIRSALDSCGAEYVELDGESLTDRVVEILSNENIVGWFQGRMEFGPRALGARSIIGDPRSPAMQSVMNLKIKYRESFRPFAPAVLAEHASEIFEIDEAHDSPYMLVVAPVREKWRKERAPEDDALFGIQKLNIARSDFPAITHVDYSARVQTVHENSNPRFHKLLSRFMARTGCPLLVNTSFNVRGEPIVESPEDAYRCFMRTEMDYLVLEDFLLHKDDQPPWKEDSSWMQEFELD